jgi:XTP/dITP diphosphohydrolase
MIIAIATSNKRKIEEIRHETDRIPGVEIVPAGSLADIGEIDETGLTFEENALIKAREVCRITAKPALADDSGLEVDALDGEPGIYSARFGNLGTDVERNALLLSKLADIPADKRGARFVCVMALVFPDGKEFLEKGECFGMINTEPSGGKGFGYDPIFYLPEKKYTMAEISMTEKNAISHRGIALRAMIAHIKKIAAE